MLMDREFNEEKIRLKDVPFLFSIAVMTFCLMTLVIFYPLYYFCGTGVIAFIIGLNAKKFDEFLISLGVLVFAFFIIPLSCMMLYYEIDRK